MLTLKHPGHNDWKLKLLTVWKLKENKKDPVNFGSLWIYNIFWVTVTGVHYICLSLKVWHDFTDFITTDPQHLSRSSYHGSILKQRESRSRCPVKLRTRRVSLKLMSSKPCSLVIVLTTRVEGGYMIQTE